MFGFIVALVIFGLMFLVVAAGFRSSERAVNTFDQTRRQRESVRVQADEIRTNRGG
jgi:type II secretory pathway pseudopilin PulG